MHLFSSHLPGVTVIAPRDLAFCAHPSFRLGPKFCNHQACRAWMVCTYHIETRTTKEFIPLWNKHTAMPLMRLVVCFDGRIILRDHSFTSVLFERSPVFIPIVMSFSCFIFSLFFSPSLILFPKFSHIARTSQFPTRLPSHNHTQHPQHWDPNTRLNY